MVVVYADNKSFLPVSFLQVANWLTERASVVSIFEACRVTTSAKVIKPHAGGDASNFEQKYECKIFEESFHE